MRPITNHLISQELTAFLVDRQARHLSPRTIEFYEDELTWFSNHLTNQNFHYIEDLTPPIIRDYLINLSTHRNPGGVHAAFRAIKAFLRWWEEEIDDPIYKNPIRKVTPPKISKAALPGIPMDHVRRLIATCKKNELGQRDRAILTILIDTGLRKEELVALNIADVNLRTGAVQVQHGKGDKKRIVYLGAKARRELLRYLRYRSDQLPIHSLFENQTHTRLSGAGLRQIIRRRSELARIPAPGLHDFRRTFALESLRNGMDVVTLMHLMGHTTTVILLRYLKLVERDLAISHAQNSPADNL